MKADIAKLQAARDLIARPGGWARRAFCRFEDGCRVGLVSQVSKSASCFCAEGAIIAITRHRISPESRALRAVLETSIVDWNDAPGRTQAEIVQGFDRAIALARSQEASS